MPKMTPDQEAAHALNFKVARSDLSPAAQVEYDRLIKERRQPKATAGKGNSGDRLIRGQDQKKEALIQDSDRKSSMPGRLHIVTLLF